MTMTVGSLFSGIGGIDLGLERAGMSVIWQSELDPYASKVLTKHWPTIPNLGDIKQIDWSTVERPDVVAGGFPCQPVSAAGRQRAQEDPRWLWPEYARCLRHLRPRYVLVENVPALFTVAGGRAAQEVFGDLALLGYDTEWCRLSAAEAGAPHLRKRVFIVAYADRGRQQVFGQQDGWEIGPGIQASQRDDADGFRADVADTDNQRRNGWAGEFGEAGRIESSDRGDDAHAHSIPPHGTSVAWGERGHWSVEPDVGRVANGIPNRVDRLRCLGNAVVPQVAQWVGEQILQHNRISA